MVDLRQRLSELDQLEAPDLWDDIERRAPDPLAPPRDPITESPPTPSPWRGPLIALGTAAAILAIVAGIATLLLRNDPSATDSPAVSPTTTSGSREATPIAPDDPWTNVIEVTFDGQECVVNGPTTVPAGRGQAFVLTNTSDVLLDLRVGKPIDTTFDELTQLQQAADGFVYDAPDAERPIAAWATEAFSFDPRAWPQIDLAEGQSLSVFSLTYGTDVVYLVTQTRQPPWTQPGAATFGLARQEGLWFCGRLDVTF
jgi:hypothetical protein